MGRAVTILGVLLLLIAGAFYARPLLLVSPSPGDGELYRPPRPVLPRSHAPLERILLGKDEPEAVAAIDLAGRGDPEGASLRLQALLKERGQTAPRLAALGLVHLSARDFPAAGKAFERAFARNPRSVLALYGRARLRLMTRRFAAARRDLRRLTRERPGHPEGWRLLAMAGIGEGDGDAAFEAAEKAVGLAPGNRAVLHTMAACLLRLGREEEAAIWSRAAGSELTATR
jgi:predicted Zn-dependent protease